MPLSDRPPSGLDKTRDPIRRHSLRRPGRAALLIAALMSLVVPCTLAWAAVPSGVWLIDGKAAVQIFDCSGLLCGRILWLQTPRDPQGQLNRDKNNPDPALLQRRLCGLTVFWGVALHRSRPLGRRLVLRPGRREDVQCLGGTQVRRPDRSAHLLGGPALRPDQDPAPGSARNIGGMVLSKGSIRSEADGITYRCR
jgi:hypothetical protein